MNGDGDRRCEADDEASLGAEGVGSDPLSDVLFTMIAAAVIALAALASRPIGGPGERARILRDSYMVDGQPTTPLIASAQGVVLPIGGGIRIALDDIGTSADLAQFLEALKARGARLLEAVDADASETALQLEPALARHAPEPLYELRAPTGCFAFDAAGSAAATCAGGPGSAR